jgi:hypothetical protein
MSCYYKNKLKIASKVGSKLAVTASLSYSVLLGEDKCSSTGDVNAHVIATTGVAFWIRLMHGFRVDTIEAAELGSVGVEYDFVGAWNFHA